MSIDDISKNIDPISFKLESINGYSTQWNAHPTNELSYFLAFASIANIPQELQNILPIFSSVFGQMSSDKYSYSELSQRIQNYTGGISTSWGISRNYALNIENEWSFQFGSHSLERNISPMFEILSDIYTLEPKDLHQLRSIISMVSKNNYK